MATTEQSFKGCAICGGVKFPAKKFCRDCELDIKELQELTRKLIEDAKRRAEKRLAIINAALDESF